jgi:hypothetical protein
MDPARAASATGVGTPVVATSSTSGFQYTPPSYLLRASDTTNRPWNYGKGVDDEGDFYGSGNNNRGESENEYDLPQEQRPQTRRESYVDAHFHQRVRTKQSRYRDIITGSETTETETEGCSNHDYVEQENYANDDDDEDDSVLLAAANVDSTLLLAKENANNSFARVRSEKLHMTQASQNNTARMNRKERITGHSNKPNPLKLRSTSEPIDAETVRSLRAHRLRSNLLKPSSDDFDLQTKLELRRLQSRKDDEQQENERSSLAASDISEFSVRQQRERKELDNERKAIQEERKALIMAKEEASYALKRAAQINEERRKQRELDAIIEMNRLEDEKITKRREQRRSNSNSNSNSNSRRRISKNNNRSMKTKSFNNDYGANANANANANADNDDMTIFDLDNDFAFLNDLSGIVRDSGLMRGCLSVTTGCFGNNDAGCSGNDETITTALQDNIIDNNNNKITKSNLKSKLTKSKSKSKTISAPDLVPCSDTSSSDIEGENGEGIVDHSNKNETNNNVNSLRRSRLSAQYRV